MKRKFLLAFMMLTFALTCSFGVAGCFNRQPEGSGDPGNSGETEHTEHIFDCKVTEFKYLKSEATCQQKAVYYYSCECGEKGEEIFESGELIDHQFDNYVYNNDATCKKVGTETSKCSFCEVTDTRETGVKEKHKYKDEVCSVCGEHEPTANLAYALSADEKSYICTGIGTSTETDIYIADEYEGKPVETINGYAFQNCNSLTSVYIPDSITIIGRSAFSGCNSLTSITVSKDNSKYYSKDNCIIESESKTLIAGCNSSVIPADGSVTAIGEDAFSECNGLSSVVIPDSVTSINTSAFASCTNMTSIYIPDSVTDIRSSVFGNCSVLTIYCEAESYSSVWLKNWNSSNCPVVWNCKNNDVADDGNIYTVAEGVRYAIKDGTATVVEQPKNISGEVAVLSAVEFKGSSYSVTSIVELAFSFCTGMTSIYIPESVTDIGGFAIGYCGEVTIYCEAESKPSGWDENWNYMTPSVVWGYKGN